MATEWTVIKVRNKVKKKLKQLKVHPRQSYGEVIEYLMIWDLGLPESYPEEKRKELFEEFTKESKQREETK